MENCNTSSKKNENGEEEISESKLNELREMNHNDSLSSRRESDS